MNQVLDGYSVPGKTFSGYESVIDNWLNRAGLSASQPGLLNHDNRERLALLSLAFNSRTYGTNQLSTPWNDATLPTLLGPKLTNALLNDDRAEAWYEIRYNSGRDARRFLESDTFGLYNDEASLASLTPNSANDADAKAAHRMLTRHRSAIFDGDSAAGGVVKKKWSLAL